VILEFGLLLYFLHILKTRGTKKGRNMLLIISVIVLVFAIISISQALYNSVTPMISPPEIPDEEYFDALGLRTAVALKAQADSMFLFILSVSYTCAKSRGK